jgi:hypothetical protein
MPFTRRTIEGWWLLCVAGLVACSGAEGSAITAGPAPDGGVGFESGVDAVYGAAADGGAASDGASGAQAAASSSTAPPLVGRADNFSPDGGVAAGPDPDDAGTSTAPASTSPSPSYDGAAAPMPPAPIPSGPTCMVTFIVTGAQPDGVLYQNVVLGGDAAPLGAWDPTKAPKMAPYGGATGEWAVGVNLAEGTTVHFKFGLTGTGEKVIWESATDTTDRALSVSCPDGGGISYLGQFNHIPDAGTP